MSLMRCGWSAFMLLMIGCLGEQASLGVTEPPARALASLSASPPVVILAVGGTQQLTPTGRTLDDAPVASFDSVVYRLAAPADTAYVRIGNDGLLTGRSASSGSGIVIHVVGFYRGTVQADLVLVQVTENALADLTLSIQPVAPDSARLAAGVRKTIVPRIRNAAGESVASPVMRYQVRADDRSELRVYAPAIRWGSLPVQPSVSPAAGTNQILPLVGEGSAWIHAEVSAYGTMLRDSVLYTFTYPYSGGITTVKMNLTLASTMAGTSLVLAPGATVTFRNGLGAADPLTVTYTFDDPSAATQASPASSVGGSSGNVTSLQGGQQSVRRFPRAGTYRWTMTGSGGPDPWAGQTVSGTIVIK